MLQWHTGIITERKELIACCFRQYCSQTGRHKNRTIKNGTCYSGTTESSLEKKKKTSTKQNRQNKQKTPLFVVCYASTYSHHKFSACTYVIPTPTSDEPASAFIRTRPWCPLSCRRTVKEFILPLGVATITIWIILLLLCIVCVFHVTSCQTFSYRKEGNKVHLHYRLWKYSVWILCLDFFDRRKNFEQLLCDILNNVYH